MRLTNLPEMIGRLRYSTDGAGYILFAISAGYGSSNVTITGCARQLSTWKSVFATEGRAGRNGFAEPDAKREGDGKSPTGSYTLTGAFGAGNPGTRLPYRRLRDIGDCWGCTPGEPGYNQYYSGACRSTDEDLSALMKSGDYRQAVVINHNRPPDSPVVSGAGSAIFLHVGGEEPTSGCISTPEPQLRTVMQTLQAGDRIIMGPAEALFR